MTAPIAQDVVAKAYREQRYHDQQEWYRDGYPLFLDIEDVTDLLEGLSILANLPLSNARLCDFARSARQQILADLRIKEVAS